MLQFCRLNRFKMVGSLIFLLLILFTPKAVYAHRDGCHRWHSCPSDSGSYTCGDLGDYTYCPNKPIAAPQPTPVPTLVPTSVATPMPVQAPPTMPLTNASPTSGIGIGSIKAAALNIRSGPGTTYSVIGTLSQGMRVTILEKRNGWLRISQSGNTESWVSAAYVNEVAIDPVASSVAPANSVTPSNLVVPATNANAPILISPTGNKAVADPVIFEWSWTGTLASGQGFDIQVWKEGEKPRGVAHPSFVKNPRSGYYTLRVSSLPYPKSANYFWRVRIVHIESGVDVGPTAKPEKFRYN